MWLATPAFSLTRALLCAVGIAAFVSAQAAGSQFRLYPSSDTIGAATPSVTAVVAPDGQVRLLLERPANTPATLDLALSAFRDDRGNTLAVTLSLPGDTAGTSPATRRQATLSDVLLSLTLQVEHPPTSDPYRGFLFLLRGDTVLARFGITLRRGPTAKLVLDGRDTIALTTTRSFTVQLREEGGEQPLEGVFVRLLGTQSGRGDFDPIDQLTFSVRDTVVDLWTTPPRNSTEARLRSIPRGEVMTVHGTLGDIPPGEYRARLRFLALDSQEDPRQVLSLIVRARDSAWWATLVLFGAILLSYIGTKWLKARHLRLQFWSKTEDQRPDWLRDEPPVLPVIWARIIYRQAGDLVRRPLLAGMDVIDARVKQVAPLLPRLDRLRKIRGQIRSLPHPWVARRAEKARQRILARLGTGGLDDNSAAEIDAALADLEAWFPKEIEARYWAYLREDIEALRDSVKPELQRVPDPARKRLDKLVEELEAALQSETEGTLAEKIECEINSYATLKVLWERYGKPGLEKDFNNLIRQHHDEGKRGQDLLDAADDKAWNQLKAAHKGGEICFTAPRRDSDEPFESYQPLLFEIQPRNPAIGDNYLFKHKGLTYAWHIRLEPDKPWWLPSLAWSHLKCAQVVNLHPITSEPRVVQYVPRAGVVTASVEVRRNRNDDPFKVHYVEEAAGEPNTEPTIEPTTEKPPGKELASKRLPVKPSTHFRQAKAFEMVEIVALVLTLVVAIATGVSTLYLDNATFGSAQDYIKLFLWGVGADQLKNVLQIFQAYSATPTTT